jgi:hypothetical protein
VRTDNKRAERIQITGQEIASTASDCFRFSRDDENGADFRNTSETV